MIDFDDVTRENIPKIPDRPKKMLIIGGSGSGKINFILNLINHQPDTDKNLFICSGSIIYAKCQLLINQGEGVDS